jgi:hypothetical protein
VAENFHWTDGRGRERVLKQQDSDIDHKHLCGTLFTRAVSVGLIDYLQWHICHLDGKRAKD